MWDPDQIGYRRLSHAKKPVWIIATIPPITGTKPINIHQPDISRLCHLLTETAKETHSMGA